MASQPDIQAGGAFIRVHLKAENMQKFFNEWGKRASAFGAKLSAAGRRAAVSAIVLSIPAIAGIKAFGMFSKEMAFVSTMVDNVGKHMGRFTEQVHKMSVEFGQSTAAMSKGLFDILSAGFHASKAIRILRVTSIAAVAGNTDVANSTKAIIAMLNSYGLSAEHAQEVSDSLFQTVRFGVLTFEELAGHIGLVAPSAASAGVKMDEMGATLAVITRAGVETSHAIVALNNILKAFIAPTGAGADFAKKLKEAGFAFDISVAGIKKSGFVNILREIGRLPTEAIAKLFPSIRSQRGILAIKAGLKSLPEILSKFINKAGSTERAFMKMSEAFGFMLDQLKAAGKLILVHFGEAIVGDIKNMSKEIVHVAIGVGKWISNNRDLIKTYVKMIGVIIVVALTMMALAKAMQVVATISLLISLLAGSWVRVAAAIAGTVAFFVTLQKIISGIKDEINSVADASEKAEKRTSDLLKSTAQSQGIRDRIEGLREVLKRKVDDAEDQKNRMLKTIGELMKARQDLRDDEQLTRGLPFFGRKGSTAFFFPNIDRLLTGEPLEGIIKRREKDVDWMQKQFNLKKKNVKVTRDLINSLLKEASAMERIAAENKALADAEKARDANTRGFQRGFFSGFFRTPNLAFDTTSTTESQQSIMVDQLQKIQINTGTGGPLEKAIIGKGESN